MKYNVLFSLMPNESVNETLSKIEVKLRERGNVKLDNFVGVTSIEQIEENLMYSKFDVLFCSDSYGKGLPGISLGKINEWRTKYPLLKIVLIVATGRKGQKKLANLYAGNFYNVLYADEILFNTLEWFLINQRSKEDAFVYMGLENFDFSTLNELPSINNNATPVIPQAINASPAVPQPQASMPVNTTMDFQHTPQQQGLNRQPANVNTNQVSHNTGIDNPNFAQQIVPDQTTSFMNNRVQPNYPPRANSPVYATEMNNIETTMPHSDANNPTNLFQNKQNEQPVPMPSFSTDEEDTFETNVHTNIENYTPAYRREVPESPAPNTDSIMDEARTFHNEKLNAAIKKHSMDIDDSDIYAPAPVSSLSFAEGRIENLISDGACIIRGLDGTKFYGLQGRRVAITILPYN